MSFVDILKPVAAQKRLSQEDLERSTIPTALQSMHHPFRLYLCGGTAHQNFVKSWLSRSWAGTGYLDNEQAVDILIQKRLTDSRRIGQMMLENTCLPLDEYALDANPGIKPEQTFVAQGGILKKPKQYFLADLPKDGSHGYAMLPTYAYNGHSVDLPLILSHLTDA
ncbi:MAG TPA: hypothetical protein VFN51_00285 [Candidatus Saccharimonadales bacterium]|nr:hypothetical protein [Candidatus Saccharimonadales bacterium]